jgi:hypothetical protein
MAAFAVAGTELQMTVASVLTRIPGVFGVSFSGGDRTDIDVTAIDDDDQVTVGGRRAAQELSFGIYYDAANNVHQALLSNYNAATAEAVVFNLVDSDAGAAVHAFSAYVKSLNHQRDVDGAGIANIVLRLTTGITTTP